MFTFTKNITAYSYSELSEQAKENVKENLYYDTVNELMQFEYNDLWESINKYAYLIGAIPNSINEYCNNDVHIELDSELEDMEGRRFLKYLINHVDFIGLSYDKRQKLKKYTHLLKCAFSKQAFEETWLTGICTDVPFLKAVHKFIEWLKKGDKLTASDFIDLWESTCTEYLNAQERWFTSEEFIEKHFNSNDYYFDSEGDYINVPAEVLKNL